MRDYDSPSACRYAFTPFGRLRTSKRIFKCSPRYKEGEPYVEDGNIWREDIFDYQVVLPPRIR